MKNYDIDKSSNRCLTKSVTYRGLPIYLQTKTTGACTISVTVKIVIDFSTEVDDIIRLSKIERILLVTPHTDTIKTPLPKDFFTQENK